jgi:hypothetical protein
MNTRMLVNGRSLLRSAAALLIFFLSLIAALAFWIAVAPYAHAATRGHQIHHRYLAQGELRNAQNYQPWAWSNDNAGWSSPVARVAHNHEVVRSNRTSATNFSGALGVGLAHMIGADRPTLSAECQTARRLGGPCGCFASEHFGLPRGYHGMNLWLANDWLNFPHVSPAPGTAAVWPGRHVAPVVGVNGDGTVTVSDPIGTRRVRSTGLVFVAPR